MSLLKKCLSLLLLLTLSLPALSAKAQTAAYRSTQAFLDVLAESGQPCELHGVDEDGAEYLTLDHTGEPFDYTVSIFFEEDQAHASLRVWYVIEFDSACLAEVTRTCNVLNAGNRFVSFYADESDHTVTASLDLIFHEEDAGLVTARAVRHLTDALHRAYPLLLACTAPAQPGTVCIRAESARLREGPDTTSGFVALAYWGERFPCLGVEGNWYAIDYHGRTAYVSAEKAVLE